LAAGSCEHLAELPDAPARVVAECRRATLSSFSADGSIATVPVCFALADGSVITQIDHKPKDAREPARLRNIRRDPRVTILFDRWDEDWTRLGWVMVKGTASVAPARAAPALVERYPQYVEDPPDGPVIVVEPRLIRWWCWE
jgi:PPOX class probable F420-dependent enzyme